MKKIFFSLVIVGSILNFSCSKNTDQPNTTITSGVSFIVDGETALQESDSKSTSADISPSNGSRLNKTVVVNSAQKADKEFIYIKEELGSAEALMANSGNSTSGDNKAVAPVYPDNYIPGSPVNGGRPLTNGVTFRVLVYDMAGKFVELVDGKVGSTPPVAKELKQGTQYKWYAYSYYSTEALPAISNNLKPTFNVSNEDFLFASGNFTTGKSSNSSIPNIDVSITFKHAMAMVEVGVLVTGFSAKGDLNAFLGNSTDRPYIRANSNVLEQGVFDLLTGKFISKSKIASAVNINARRNYAADIQFPNTSYHGYFFTVPGGDNEYNSNFAYSIHPWALLDRPANPLKFSKSYNDKIRIGRGKYTRITIIPLDNGIQVPATSSVVATNWSRGDLYYDAGTQGFTGPSEGPTRFQHRNHEPNSIFYASTFQPNGYPNPIMSYGQSEAKYGSTYYLSGKMWPLGITPVIDGDPCHDLRPNGNDLNDQWRTPTVDQAKGLAAYINSYSGTGRISATRNDGKKSVLLTVNVNEQNSPDEWSQRITFELKRFTEPNGNTHQMNAASLPSISSTKTTGYAYFWLKKPYANSYAYLELYYDSSIQNKLRAKVYSSKVTSAANDVYPATLKATNGMNVRCVRNFN